jgi:hypothetical protein
MLATSAVPLRGSIADTLTVLKTLGAAGAKTSGWKLLRR